MLVGIAIVGADTRKAALGAIAIAGFFCGALAGSWFVRDAPSGGVWPADVTRALAVECVVLTCAAAAWYFYPTSDGYQALYLFGLGSAMGLQAGAVRASIWLFYVAGAAGGALLSRFASGLEIAAPAGIVVGCVIVAAAVFGTQRVA